MTTSPQHENETTEQYVLRLMEEAVALKGADYVYEHQPTNDPDALAPTTCYYVWDNQPSCIVGHVLHAAGIPLEELARHEGGSAHIVVAAVAPHDWDGLVGNALNSAQAMQDAGGTWGEALETFKSELPEPTHYLAGQDPNWKP